MHPSRVLEQKLANSFPATILGLACSGAFASGPAISFSAFSVSLSITSAGISSKEIYLGGDPRICVAMLSANSLTISSLSSSVISGSVDSYTMLPCSPISPRQGRWMQYPYRHPSVQKVSALRMRIFYWNFDFSSFSYSSMFFIPLSQGKMLLGWAFVRNYSNLPLVSYSLRPSTFTYESLWRIDCPILSTKVRNKSLFATKSVSELTSKRTAFLLQGVMNEAITPYLVYLSILISEFVNPLLRSSSSALSMSFQDYCRALWQSLIETCVIFLKL